MQHILILGAGKSATILIEHLIRIAGEHDFFIHVADGQKAVAESKINGHARAAAYAVDPEDMDGLHALVSKADLVISMLPPPFHPLVVKACVKWGKHFLNASYLTPEISSFDEEARKAGLTVLCEMGLDPGIDHMSAMEMIHDIQAKGGRITSFRSHCGGLISPESDDNPWHYKISWNPRNIVMAGADGAQYLEHGKQVFVPYTQLFNPSQRVSIPEYGEWCWYANRDSIAYIAKYGLDGITQFVRTTLRHPDFCHGWKKAVDLGLTATTPARDTTGMYTRDFFAAHIQANPAIQLGDALSQQQFRFLGMDTDELLPAGSHSPADTMQWILERKLALSKNDKDMIIMLHELEYDLEGRSHSTKAHLVVKGEDPQHTAMARTVGMPLAIAAKHILQKSIDRPGVSIPITDDIYRKVLPELEHCGIGFIYTN
jgi:saccharopine dehydrogenase (NADP+, L-glutamate forming)